MKFRIISQNTKDHWLELEGTSGGYAYKGKERVPIWDIHVVCKWDGCIDYRSYSNGYDWKHECSEDCPCCEDYIHICDIDAFADGLRKIKKIAIEFYKGKQGEEYWPDET